MYQILERAMIGGLYIGEKFETLQEARKYVADKILKGYNVNNFKIAKIYDLGLEINVKATEHKGVCK